MGKNACRLFVLLFVFTMTGACKFLFPERYAVESLYVPTVEDEIIIKAADILPAVEHSILVSVLDDASEQDLGDLNNAIDSFLDAVRVHQEATVLSNTGALSSEAKSVAGQNIEATKNLMSNIFGNLDNDEGRRAFLNAGIGFSREILGGVGGSLTGAAGAGGTFSVEAGAGFGIAYDFLNFSSYAYGTLFCAGNASIAIGIHGAIEGTLSGIVSEKWMFGFQKDEIYSGGPSIGESASIGLSGDMGLGLGLSGSVGAYRELEGACSISGCAPSAPSGQSTGKYGFSWAVKATGSAGASFGASGNLSYGDTYSCNANIGDVQTYLNNSDPKKIHTIAAGLKLAGALIITKGASGSSLTLPAAATAILYGILYEDGWVGIRQFGSESYDEAYGITVDGAGDVYVAGHTSGDFGGVNQGELDVVGVKYSNAGAGQWVRQLGTAVRDFAYGIAFDETGNVYLAGVTWGNFGGVNQGQGDILVVKCSSVGAQQWVRQLGSIQNDVANGVAVDGAGNVYAAGWAAADLGGHLGFTDIVLVKYTSAGAQQWVRHLGTSSSEMGKGVAVDGAGNVYIAGETHGDFGGVNQGGQDIVLVKCSSAGAQQWVRQLGSAGQDIAFGVAVDGTGNVYIAGTTYGDLGGVNHGGRDIVIIKYTSAGAQQWVRQLGSDSDDYAYGIAVDSAGNAYMAGHTHGDLGGVNQGFRDIVIIKYDAAGILQ